MALTRRKCPVCRRWHFFTKQQWHRTLATGVCQAPKLTKRYDGKEPGEPDK